MKPLYLVTLLVALSLSSCIVFDNLFKKKCAPAQSCSGPVLGVNYDDPTKPFFEAEVVLTINPGNPLLENGVSISDAAVSTLVQSVFAQALADNPTLNLPQAPSIERCICDENIFLINVGPSIGAENNVTQAGNARPDLGDEGGGFGLNYLIQNSNQDEGIPQFVSGMANMNLKSTVPVYNQPVVAILDSGIDESFFNNRDGFFTSGSSDAAVCGIPSNGALAEVTGYDFISRPPGPDVTDYNGHGTAVALAYKFGLDKMRPSQWLKQRLLPVKVLDDCGNGSVYSAACGIAYAKQRGAKIINLSFGLGFNCNQLEMAIASVPDAAVVCSAGNDSQVLNNSNHFPSGYAHMFSTEVYTSTSTLPAMQNVYEVMALSKNFEDAGIDPSPIGLSLYSNRRTNNFAELGNGAEYLIGQIKQPELTCCMEGTSFAAPLLSASILQQTVFSGGVLPTKSDVKINSFTHTIPGGSSGPITYSTFFNKKAI